MATTKTHTDRKVKNYILMTLLFVVVLMIFSITIIKLQIAGENMNKAPASTETTPASAQ